MRLIRENITIFELWFWKESPVKVHLAVLNWELGCKSPTVPQQWTPLWLLSINAIVRLDEKALGSGGKSEDQPFSVRKPPHHDVWCRLAQVDFMGIVMRKDWHVPCSLFCPALLCTYVYYYIGFTGQSVVRQHFLIYRIFEEIEIWNMNQLLSCTTAVRLLQTR